MADTRIKLKADFTQIQNATRQLINSITNVNRVFGTLPKPILNAQQTLAKMAYTAKQNRGLFLQLGTVVKRVSTNFTQFGQTVSNAQKINATMTSSLNAGAIAFARVGQAAVAAGTSVNYYATSAARAVITPFPQGPPTSGGAKPKVQSAGAGAAAGAKAAGGAMKGASASANLFSKSLLGVGVTLKNLSYTFAPFAAIMGAAAMLGFAKEATELNNRLRIVTPTGKKVGDTFAKIAKVAKETRTSVKETAVVFTRFSIATERSGYSQEQMLTAVSNLNKMMKIQGVSSHEARSAMLQLSQGLQSGRLAGDEFRAVQEILPALLGDIAHATGYPITQLKELASQGKITPQIVMDALLGNTAKIDRMFQRTTMTFEDFGTAVSNTFITALAEIQNLTGGAESLSGAFDVLLNVVEIIAEAIKIVIKVAMVLGGVIAKVDQFLGDLSLKMGGIAKFLFPFASEMGKIKEAIPGTKEAGLFAQWTAGFKANLAIVDEALNTFLDKEKPKEEMTDEAKRQAELDAKRKADAVRQQAALDDFNTLKTGMNFSDMVMSLDILDEKMGEVFYQGLFEDMPQGFGGAVSNMIMEGESLKDGLSKMFKDMAKKIIASLVAMVVQMLIVQAIMSTLGLTTLNMMGTDTGGGGGFTGLFKGLGKSLFGGGKKKALGGPVASGNAYLVGEQGPEIFAPASSGSIIPNDEIGGVGGGLVIQNLSIMPNASIDQALMDKPASYWLEMVQAKVLPALNELGQGGETTTLGLRGAR
jgi:tape measure domain-containing protein|tara:strand:+ start:2995 stop:5274 length:2280 start_codon:yes stop_codon:yes gene_type:complete